MMGVVIISFYLLQRRGCRGPWIYNYLYNQCLSPLMLWVWIPLLTRCTTLCDKVCQWLATGQWFSPCSLVSSTNKTDRHNITEILLKVVLNPIYLTLFWRVFVSVSRHYQHYYWLVSIFMVDESEMFLGFWIHFSCYIYLSWFTKFNGFMILTRLWEFKVLRMTIRNLRSIKCV